MEWKRNTHNENNTRLLETYSYYNSKGVLISKLREKLEKAGVKFKKIEIEDLYRLYDFETNKSFNESIKLIGTFLELFKSHDFKDKKFDEYIKASQKSKNDFERNRKILFFKISRILFKEYQNRLKSKGQIDFSDLINRAAKYINEEKVSLKYKYIIVDEFQDIAYGRYRLLKSIIEKSNAKLMCVGDDWQSIYRFAGSDISIFKNFEKYFGYCEKMKIDQTYRNSQELLDMTREFILKNPEQIEKRLSIR